MKKWILIGIGSLIVIIIIVLVVGLSNLGPMIKSAVNTYGPGITKTEVRLGDVKVSLFSAEAELKGFYLGNPKGFKSPQAMKVKSIKVDVNEKSLTGDTIVIDRIEVVAPEITYEKIRGTDNFKTILNNVNETVGTDKTQAEKQAEKKEGGKKILIKNFIVRDGKVGLIMPILSGQTLSASLPDIHLKDLGKKKGGASPAEVFKEAFASLYQKITSPAVTDIFNNGLKSLGTNLEAVGDKGKKELETVKDTFKGLLNN
ncbi:AsmA family protein [Thermodesulfobacteriota bacterium]